MKTVMDLIKFPPNVAAFIPPSDDPEECRVVIAGLMARLSVDFGPRAGVSAFRYRKADGGRLPLKLTREDVRFVLMDYLHRLPAGRKLAPVWRPFREGEAERPFFLRDPGRLAPLVADLYAHMGDRDGSVVFAGVWIDPALRTRGGLPPIITWPEQGRGLANTHLLSPEVIRRLTTAEEFDPSTL